jgi:hypothetical protein
MDRAEGAGGRRNLKESGALEGAIGGRMQARRGVSGDRAQTVHGPRGSEGVTRRS